MPFKKRRGLKLLPALTLARLAFPIRGWQAPQRPSDKPPARCLHTSDPASWPPVVSLHSDLLCLSFLSMPPVVFPSLTQKKAASCSTAQSFLSSTSGNMVTQDVTLACGKALWERKLFSLSGMMTWTVRVSAPRSVCAWYTHTQDASSGSCGHQDYTAYIWGAQEVVSMSKYKYKPSTETQKEC